MTFPRRRDDGYEVDTAQDRLDMDAICDFLATAYWSIGVPCERVTAAIRGSLPFGLYGPDGAQAGFARMVTDRARFAWLADVFVLESHRGLGLGVWLVQTAIEHPDVDGLRIVLATADAHGVYARFGFAEAPPGRFMERPLRLP
jgi:GNAT superfamily N-acetyltransferase